MAGRTRQPMQGPQPLVGLADGHERILSHGQIRVPDRVQVQGQARVVVSKHQVAIAIDQGEHGIMHIGGNHARAQVADMPAHGVEPARQEVQGYRVSGRDLKAGSWHAMFGPDNGARIDQFAQDVVRRFLEQAPGGREGGGVSAPVDKVGAHPLLERLDASAEARLGDVADLRRA